MNLKVDLEGFLLVGGLLGGTLVKKKVTLLVQETNYQRYVASVGSG